MALTNPLQVFEERFSDALATLREAIVQKIPFFYEILSQTGDLLLKIWILGGSGFDFVAKFTVKNMNKDFINAVQGGGVAVLWKYFIKNGIFWTMASLSLSVRP